MDTPQFAAGRKIFYFFPAGNFHRLIVSSVIEAEYEIYTLSDYRRGLPLMFQHNGAVVLFNIEEQAGNEQLRGMMRDFCRQSSSRSIQLYLLSRSEEQLQSLTTLSGEFANCSSLHLPEDPAQAAELLHRILGKLQVRGQRRYVRFGSNSDSIATITFERRGRRYTGTVHDISSAGLSFTLPGEGSVPLRSRLKEVAVEFGSGISELSGTVTIRRRLPSGSSLYILMFDKGMDPELKRRLRTAIHWSLQRQFAARLAGVAVPD